MSRKIPYALYSKTWDYNLEDINSLDISEEIVADEYDNTTMRKNIFCPSCFTPLTRSPLVKDFSSNGTLAFFKHLKLYNSIRCIYRANIGEGLFYENEEDAIEAINNKKLVVINSFLKERPQRTVEINDNDYDDTLIENRNDPATDVPISRHKGTELNLPSVITTVRALCRKFPDNLIKHYVLPNSNLALPLIDLLNPVTNLVTGNEIPELYIGKIIVNYPNGTVQKTKLEFNSKSNEFDYFYIETNEPIHIDHHINTHAVDRYIMVYGRVDNKVRGFWMKDLGWGEVSLIPEKYNKIVESIIKLKEVNSKK